MKKIALLLCLAISMFALGQKKELKKIEKKINSYKLGEAKERLNKIASTVKDTSFESYFLFLKGKAFFNRKDKKEYKDAAKEFYKVLDLEFKTGVQQFSKKSIECLQAIDAHFFKVTSKALVKKRYNNAAGVYQMLFNVRPSRQDFLQATHYAFGQAKNKEKKAKTAELLLKLQGNTVFQAKNIHSNATQSFFTKVQRDKAISQKTHHKPSEQVVDENKKTAYYNAIITFYSDTKNNAKLLKILEKAKTAFPKNINYHQYYVNAVYKTGNKLAYVKAIEEALVVDPKNKTLFFNLGVANKELNKRAKALAAYDKAIALDSDYRAAYINKGVLILADENKLIDELNKNLSNKKKYDQIDKQLTQMYSDAIPLFQKAYDLKHDEKIKTSLIGLYKAVGQPDKINTL